VTVGRTEIKVKSPNSYPGRLPPYGVKSEFSITVNGPLKSVSVVTAAVISGKIGALCFSSGILHLVPHATHF
jgi:hypothetical protein